MFGRTLISSITFLVLFLLSSFFPDLCRAQEGSPAGPIPPELLQARRARLLEALDGATALLSSAREQDIEAEYAQASDYREDNDFLYLTGLEAPGGWLLVNGPEEREMVLYLPPRAPGAERWTGEKLGPGSYAEALTGLSEVRSVQAFWGDLAAWARRVGGGKTLFLSGGDEGTRERLAALGEGGAPRIESLDPLVAPLRLIKDGEELRRLRRAAEITMEAHQEVWRTAEPGLFEYQIEAVLEFVFHLHGAERVGFPSIVGSGPNSTILHYDDSRRQMEHGELVVVDIGAEYGYYTADITRTFPVSGRFTSRQKALYDLVLGAWHAGLSAIRPGSTIGEVNAAVRAHLQEQSGDLCGETSCAPHLLHGVAHWLGMDVHDVGSTRTPFAPGMVLTLEPGLYLPEEELGIRVEDDILVTDDGFEILTEALPRTTAEIEAVMREEPRYVRPIPGWH